MDRLSECCTFSLLLPGLTFSVGTRNYIKRGFSRTKILSLASNSFHLTFKHAAKLHFTIYKYIPHNMSDTGSDGVSTPELLSSADLDGITTSSLEALQGDGQRKILDIVDDLRRQGLSSVVELPQLVVCGDQSSGEYTIRWTLR